MRKGKDCDYNKRLELALNDLHSAWGYIIVRVMVFNVTFNNMLGSSWQSVLLVEETGVTGENHQPTTRH
jgi:hypothetical protein